MRCNLTLIIALTPTEQPSAAFRFNQSTGCRVLYEMTGSLAATANEPLQSASYVRSPESLSVHDNLQFQYQHGDIIYRADKPLRLFYTTV